MNEFEFASAYLGEYKVHGSEIVPALCPFCNGGDSHDRNTFALNTENHTYNCKRASCGEKGHFKELCDKYGVSMDEPNKPTYAPPRKAYKPAETKISKPTDPVSEYLKLRGISEETASKYGIGSDENGNIVFPFYRTADDYVEKTPTFVKFRPARKIQKGERKMWREADTEPILFGLHLCDRKRKTLYICEGEFDCLSFFQVTQGVLNIVSVPSGAEDFTWIETCEEELKQYDTLAVIGDSDAAGRKMATSIELKFPDKTVMLPNYDLYQGCKDTNEIVFRRGETALCEVIKSMQAKPVEGLINISDITPLDYSKIGRTISGIPLLDKITGGMFDGDLSIWTGKRGEGKSTLLNQIGVNAIEQGKNVCVYSGEVPKERFKYQIMLCAAGYSNIKPITDNLTGREIFVINPSAEAAIDKWLDHRLWVYDNDLTETDEREHIISIFTSAYRRYDCRVFIVDNLMTISAGAKANEVMHIQADFVIRLRKFANKYGVHVHCVVHPRKTVGAVSDSDDVSGLGIITNIACNVFDLHRLSDSDREKNKCDAVLNVFKNRAFGERGIIKLMYDDQSRQFYEAYKPRMKYSWDKQPEPHFQDIPNDAEIPF